MTPKLRVEYALDVRFFFTVFRELFLLVLGKVAERFLVAGGEDEHFVSRFPETEVVDVLNADGGFLADVLFVAFRRRRVEADDGVVAIDFRSVGVVEERTRVTDDGASATERFRVWFYTASGVDVVLVWNIFREFRDGVAQLIVRFYLHDRFPAARYFVSLFVVRVDIV